MPAELALPMTRQADRGKSYTVQGTGPDSWKWTVQLDERTVKSGLAKTRASATTNAIWAIDKALVPDGRVANPPGVALGQQPSLSSLLYVSPERIPCSMRLLPGR